MTGLPAVPRAQCANRPAAARLFRWGSPAIPVASGTFALAVGVLVYAADRTASSTTLIPGLAWIAAGPLFGAFGHWLPSFVHPFAFSLFTAAAHPSKTSPPYWTCVAWWVVNVAFEVAQRPATSLRIATGIQDVFGQTWLTRPLSNYVLRGTFDVGDLMAATAGALAAASVLHIVHRLGVRDEHC